MILLLAVVFVCYGIAMFTFGVKWSEERFEQAQARARVVRWRQEEQG